MSDDSTLVSPSGSLNARIAAHGAELVSLLTRDGEELLWQAGPAWRRHAPVLFPVIGRAPGDAIHHDGVDYPISQHGFARDREFALVEAGSNRVLYRLESDDGTRAHFPFDFALEIEYLLDDETLTIRQTVENRGGEPLGASLGNHPAFPWPLPGADRAAHTIEFAEPEDRGYQRGPDNLLLPELHASPLDGTILALDDRLFDDGALIFSEPRRRVLRYSAPGSRTLVVDTGDFTTLGVWAPVGADFVCIEPWAGYPTPQGWDGDILDKPGQFRCAPAESKTFSYSLSVEEKPAN